MTEQDDNDSMDELSPIEFAAQLAASTPVNVVSDAESMGKELSREQRMMTAEELNRHLSQGGRVH